MTEDTQPTRSKRLEGMLWASFAGDALALGVHWIYDPSKIREISGELDSYTNPKEGALLYHSGKQAGDFTHYGDQALALLRAVREAGEWSPQAFVEQWVELFSGEDTPYMDKATKETVRNRESGVPLEEIGSLSREMEGAARFAPLYVALSDRGAEERIEAVKAQARLRHRGAGSAECAGFLCETADAILEGATVREALERTVRDGPPDLNTERMLLRAEKVLDRSAPEAVAELGPACGLPGALESSMRILLEHGADVEGALIANTMAGGDSASRGLVIGALSGAAAGVDGVPARWRDHLRVKDEIGEAVEAWMSGSEGAA